MRGAAIVVACALAGCQERTELMVGFATDMPAPGTLDRISLLVERNGVPLLTESWTLEPNESLPGSYAIVADEAATLTLTLTGSRGGEDLVERTAILPLVEGETLFYRMGLTLACSMGDVECPQGSVCVEGNCVAPDISAQKLPDYTDALVSTLTCRSNATYIKTASGEPMDVSADADLCPASLCSEGTCLNPPSTARVFKGSLFGSPFDLLIDGNTFTLGVLNQSALASSASITASTVSGSVPLGDVTVTIEGTIANDTLTGTLTVPADPANGIAEQVLPFAGLELPAATYCGQVSGGTAFDGPFQLLATSSRAAGGFRSNNTPDDAAVGGSFDGTVNGENFNVAFTGLAGQTGTMLGTIRDGEVEGELIGTENGVPFNAQFQASTDACLTTACGPGEIRVDNVCLGTGELRFTVQWDQPFDVDLHVLTPLGNEISFENESADTGTLDQDHMGGSDPVLLENVFFTAPPPGVYEAWAVNFDGSTENVTGTLTIASKGRGVPPPPIETSFSLATTAGSETAHVMFTQSMLQRTRKPSLANQLRELARARRK